MSENQIHIRALLVAALERAQYGIRTYDYERYWKHCTSKLAKLRKKHGLTKAKVSHKLKADQSAGPKKKSRGRNMKPVIRMEFSNTPFPKSSEISDNGPLMILLFEAERAWATASSMRNAGNPRDVNRRLHRGLKSALHLRLVADELKSEGRITATSLAEVEAYATQFAGEVNFRTNRNEDSLRELSNSWTITSFLAQAATSPTIKVALLANASEVSSLMQLSAQKLRLKATSDMTQLASSTSAWRSEFEWDKIKASLTEETFKAKANHKTLKPIMWKNQEIQILHGEMVKPMLAVQKQTEKYERAQRAAMRFNNNSSIDTSTSMLPIDKFLMAVGEAEGISARLLQHEKATVEHLKSTNMASASALASLHQYIYTQLKQTQVCRNSASLNKLFAVVDTRLPENTKVTSHEFQLALSKSQKYVDWILKDLNDLLAMENDDIQWQQLSFAQHFFQMKKRIITALYCASGSAPNHAEALSMTQLSKVDLRYAKKLKGALLDQEWHWPFEIKNFDLIESMIHDLERRSTKELFLSNLRESEDAGLPKVVYDVAASYLKLPISQLELLAQGLPPKTNEISEPQVSQASEVQLFDTESGSEESESSDVVQDSSKSSAKSGWFGGLWGRK